MKTNSLKLIKITSVLYKKIKKSLLRRNLESKLYFDDKNILCIDKCDKKVLYEINKYFIDKKMKNKILIECDDNLLSNSYRLYFEEYENDDNYNESKKYCDSITNSENEVFSNLKCESDKAWLGLGNEHYVLKRKNKTNDIESLINEIINLSK